MVKVKERSFPDIGRTRTRKSRCPLCLDNNLITIQRALRIRVTSVTLVEQSSRSITTRDESVDTQGKSRRTQRET